MTVDTTYAYTRNKDYLWKPTPSVETLRSSRLNSNIGSIGNNDDCRTRGIDRSSNPLYKTEALGST